MGENIDRRLDGLNGYFYRMHEDVTNNNALVKTLTEEGLDVYLMFRCKEEGRDLINKIETIIDYDLQAGPNFSDNMQRRLKEKLTEDIVGRKHYIVHRDGHTVLLTREVDENGVNCFLLTDSYNAYGATDADHLPLLEIVRGMYPNAEIYTLNDKIQRDYNNCRIFAVESAIRYEEFCNVGNRNIIDLKNSNDQIYFDPNNINNNNNNYNNKKEAYNELKIEAIPTPLPIIPLIQSMKQIKGSSNNEEKLQKNRVNDYETYSDVLYYHVKTKEDNSASTNKINRTIQDYAEKFERAIFDITKKFEVTKEDELYGALSSVYDELRAVATENNRYFYGNK